MLKFSLFTLSFQQTKFDHKKSIKIFVLYHIYIIIMREFMFYVFYSWFFYQMVIEHIVRANELKQKIWLLWCKRLHRQQVRMGFWSTVSCRNNSFTRIELKSLIIQHSFCTFLAMQISHMYLYAWIYSFIVNMEDNGNICFCKSKLIIFR